MGCGSLNVAIRHTNAHSVKGSRCGGRKFRERKFLALLEKFGVHKKLPRLLVRSRLGEGGIDNIFSCEPAL